MATSGGRQKIASGPEPGRSHDAAMTLNGRLAASSPEALVRAASRCPSGARSAGPSGDQWRASYDRPPPHQRSRTSQPIYLGRCAPRLYLRGTSPHGTRLSPRSPSHASSPAVPGTITTRIYHYILATRPLNEFLLASLSRAGASVFHPLLFHELSHVGHSRVGLRNGHAVPPVLPLNRTATHAKWHLGIAHVRTLRYIGSCQGMRNQYPQGLHRSRIRSGTNREHCGRVNHVLFRLNGGIGWNVHRGLLLRLGGARAPVTGCGRPGRGQPPEPGGRAVMALPGPVDTVARRYRNTTATWWQSSPTRPISKPRSTPR